MSILNGYLEKNLYFIVYDIFYRQIFYDSFKIKWKKFKIELSDNQNSSGTSSLGENF